MVGSVFAVVIPLVSSVLTRFALAVVPRSSYVSEVPCNAFAIRSATYFSCGGLVGGRNWFS